MLYDPPERVSFRQTNKTHSKSEGRCPGVIQLESRYFMVKCSFDMHIGFGRDDKGKRTVWEYIWEPVTKVKELALRD